MGWRGTWLESEYSHRPIPAGIALVTFVTFSRYSVTDPIPAGIASRDPAYAGEYSHRPISAGIALVTFVTFSCYCVTDPIPAGIASRGTRLMPVSTATDQSQLGLPSSLFVTFPCIMSQTQSQLGLLRGGRGLPVRMSQKREAQNQLALLFLFFCKSYDK